MVICITPYLKTMRRNIIKVFKRKPVKKRQLRPYYYILQGGDLEFVIYCIVVVGALSLAVGTALRTFPALYKGEKKQDNEKTKSIRKQFGGGGRGGGSSARAR